MKAPSEAIDFPGTRQCCLPTVGDPGLIPDGKILWRRQTHLVRLGNPRRSEQVGS